jgi:hypothetical protein
LLVRIAFAMLEALDETVSRPEELDIHIWNADDDQPFRSPQGLRDNLIKASARRMNAAYLSASSGSVRVDVSVVRKRGAQRSWLQRAALLEVTSGVVAKADVVDRVHERVYHTMSRGEPRWGSREATAKGFCTNTEGFEQGPSDKIEERWTSRALGGVIIVGVVWVIVVPVVEVFGKPALLVSLATGALLGLLASVTIFLGGISLGSMNRVLRTRQLAVALATSAVGAGISAGIRAIAN